MEKGVRGKLSRFSDFKLHQSFIERSLRSVFFLSSHDYPDKDPLFKEETV